MTRAVEQEIAKIKSLIATATNARQKAMYQELLKKAQRQVASEKDAVAPEKIETGSGSSVEESKPKRESNHKAVFSKKSKEIDDKAEKITKEDSQTQPNTETKKIFQAIGVLEGVVAIAKEEQLTVTIDGQKYRLGCTAKSKQRYKALVEEIQSQGSSTKRVSVYPQISYNKEQESYKVYFNLVTVANTEEAREGIFQDLAAGEFYLSGFWQYVPFCDAPVIAVLRNYSEGLIKIKEKVGTKKAKKLLKPNYIPVDWADAPHKPFKYDPDVEKKQQMSRYFVRLKAKFQPEKNHFEAIEQIGDSTTQAPKYLK